MLIARWLLFISLVSLLSRDRKHPQKKLGGPKDGTDPAYGQQPGRSPKPTYEKGWHSQEEEHRRREGRYWLATSVLSAVVAIGAGLSARYTYSAASEAHEQVVQARRQAVAAEDQLTVTTRARLKLLPITDAYVAKAEGVNVAWFNFKPTYKNFGPTPAENISFQPHIFVVGAGSSPRKTCETGWGWTMPDASTDIVFSQEEGGNVWVGIQVPLQKLKDAAATVLAIQPSTTVYLGVVGCLLYRSGSSANTYVTGFVGSLHIAGQEQGKPEEYVPLYDIITTGGDPMKIGMEVKSEGAWAD